MNSSKLLRGFIRTFFHAWNAENANLLAGCMRRISVKGVPKANMEPFTNGIFFKIKLL